MTNTPIFGGPSNANPNQPISPVTGVVAGQPGSFTGYGTNRLNATELSEADAIITESSLLNASSQGVALPGYTLGWNLAIG